MGGSAAREEEVLGAVRCWYCGAQPLEVAEVTAYGDLEPQFIAGRWPAASDGHAHAVVPPTPSELAAGGDAALQRIIEDWGK